MHGVLGIGIFSSGSRIIRVIVKSKISIIGFLPIYVEVLLVVVVQIVVCNQRMCRIRAKPPNLGFRACMLEFYTKGIPLDNNQLCGFALVCFVDLCVSIKSQTSVSQE